MLQNSKSKITFTVWSPMRTQTMPRLFISRILVPSTRSHAHRHSNIFWANYLQCMKYLEKYYLFQTRFLYQHRPPMPSINQLKSLCSMTFHVICKRMFLIGKSTKAYIPWSVFTQRWWCTTVYTRGTCGGRGTQLAFNKYLITACYMPASLLCMLRRTQNNVQQVTEKVKINIPKEWKACRAKTRRTCQGPHSPLSSHPQMQNAKWVNKVFP